MPLSPDDFVQGEVTSNQGLSPQAPSALAVSSSGEMSPETFAVNDNPNTATSERPPVRDAMDYIGRGFNFSRRDSISSAGWFDAMRGQISDEDAMLQFAPSKLEQDEQNGMLDYENAHYWSLEHVAKEIVGIVPYLIQNAQDAAPIVGGAVATGAGAGALTGGAAISFTPAVVGAPVTIPAGAGAGAALGAAQGLNLGVRSGIIYSAGKLASGAMYRDLRLKGVPRDKALPAAIAAGTVGGLIQGWQYSRIPSVIRSALGRPEIKRTALNTMAQIAKEVGLQVTAAELDQAANILIEGFAGAPVSWEEIQRRLKDSAIKTLMVAGSSVLGAHLAGSAIEQAARKHSGSPIEQAASVIRDLLTTDEATENMKLIELKAEEKVAKAEENLTGAKKDLEEAITNKEPIGSKKIAVQIAEEELKQAKSELPVTSLLKLEGRIVKEQKRQEREKQKSQPEPEPEVRSPKVIAKEVEKLKEDIAQTKSELDKLNDSEPDGDHSGTEALLKRQRKELRQLHKDARKARFAEADTQINAVLDAASSKYVIEKNQYLGAAIKENQAIITAYIKNSPIEKEFQAPFITAVKETQTQNQLLKVADGFTLGPESKTPGRFVPGVRQRIRKIMQQEELADAHEELKATLKAVQNPNEKSKKRTSRYPAEIQDLISKYREFVPYNKKKDKFDEPVKAEAWLKESNELKLQLANDTDKSFAAGNIEDPSVIFNRELVDLVAGDTLIDYENPDAVRNLSDKLFEIHEIGKTKALTEKQNEVAQFKAVADGFYSEVQGEKKHQVDLESSTPKRISKAEELARVGGFNLMPFNSMLGTLTQHSISQEYTNRIQNQLTNALVNTHDSIMKEHDRALETVIGKDNDKVLKEALRMQMTGGKNPKDGWGSYTTWKDTGKKDEEGKPIRVKYETQYHATEGQVLQDIIDMRNATSELSDVDGAPKMWAGIALGNKFTFKENLVDRGRTNEEGKTVYVDKNPVPLSPGEVSFEQLLEEIQAQNPHLKEMADGAMKFFNSGDTYARQNEFHRKVFGYDMPKTGMYTGPRNRESYKFTADEGSQTERLISGAISNNTKRSLVPASTIEVVGSTLPYQRVDFFDNLSRFIHDTETWRGMRDTERLLAYVLSRPEIRKAIKLKFESEGKGSGSVLKILDHQYMSTVGTRSIQHVQRIKFINDLRSRIGPAFTYGKPLNIVGQISSMQILKNYITDAEYKSGVDFAEAHPSQVIETMSKLPIYKVRYDSFANELVERRQQQGIFGEKLDPKIIQATGLGLTLGDKYVYFVGGYAVRQAYINRALGEGKSMKEAVELGNTMAQRAINETQGSALPDQVTYFERGGDLNKMVTMFGKPVIQQSTATALAIRRALANPNVKTADDARRTILNYMTASAIFVAWQQITALAWKGLTGDLENKDLVNAFNKISRYYAFPWLSLPLVGDLLDFGVEAVQLGVERSLADVGIIDASDVPKKTLRDYNPQFLPYRILKSAVLGPLEIAGLADDVVHDKGVKPSKVFNAVIDILSSWALLGTSFPLTPPVKAVKPFVIKAIGEDSDGGSGKLPSVQ